MNIVLIGHRGSGKTAVGRLLADKLGWTFVDTDLLVEQRSARTIRDIYSGRAEEGFRDIESQVVAEIARQVAHVIATGGGAVLRPDNAQALKCSGRLVWLAASPEVLWERIQADATRIHNRPNDPSLGLQTLRDVLREREPVYAGWADIVVETTGQSPNEVAEQILSQLGLEKKNCNPASTPT
jgi:shikimate kinase